MFIAFALAAAAPVALPEGAALTEAVRARDAEFFALMFEGCDPARLRTMLSPDFEMYHDRDGVVARSADAFVADYARFCAERQAPDAWRCAARWSAPASTSIRFPAMARSRTASTSSTSAGATGPNALSAAPASPNCGG